jgi:hypothetical protein
LGLCAVTQAKLHEVYLQRKFTPCVWASAAVVRDCNLAKGGEEPVTVPLFDGSNSEFYNLGQLLHFARTASGVWFPMHFQRALCSERFKQKHRSTVWFTEHQLGNGTVPLPGQTPAQLTLGGKVHQLYNTDQLVPPARAHVFCSGFSVLGGDVFVLEHVARRHGFTSNMWSAEHIVGIRPGVECNARVLHSRFGVLGVYNRDQLVWPIPVPDPPHCWASGSSMPPHVQVVLEQARVRLGLTSRRWVSAYTVSRKLTPGAKLTTVEHVTPRRTMELVNTDQLVHDNPDVPSDVR